MSFYSATIIRQGAHLILLCYFPQPICREARNMSFIQIGFGSDRVYSHLNRFLDENFSYFSNLRCAKGRVLEAVSEKQNKKWRKNGYYHYSPLKVPWIKLETNFHKGDVPVACACPPRQLVYHLPKSDQDCIWDLQVSDRYSYSWGRG